MEKFLAMFLANLTFYYVLTHLNIYIYFTFHRKLDDDYLSIDVKLFRNIGLYHIHIPKISHINMKNNLWPVSDIKVADKETQTRPGREKRFVKKLIRYYIKYPNRLHRFFYYYQYYKKLYTTTMHYILSGTECEYFSWKTRVGSSDAALTAWIAAVGWVFKSYMIINLTRRIPFTSKPRIVVYPIFSDEVWETELECIFKIRFGNLITAFTNLIKLFSRKEAVKDG